MVEPSTPLELIEAAPFVSRGGEKLAGALDAFGIDPAGRVCLDVGASTGGFTDCLLQRGASRVYALDVGRGQLAESLRVDPRVVSMERTHAARLDPDASDRLVLPEAATLTVADVSFISLTRLLRGMAAATAPGGDILPMVKPQFELSPREVPGGVVRDPVLRAAAVERVRTHATAVGLDVRGEAESPLVGPSGQSRVVPVAPGAGRLERYTAAAAAAAAARRSRPMKRIGFAYNPTNEQALELRERATGWCSVRDVDSWASPAGDLDRLISQLPTTDALVVLGGDGTFLRAAQGSAAVDVPILGINCGKVGFLSKAESHAMESVLGQLMEGAWTIEPRMMLEVRILRRGAEHDAVTHLALNDAAVVRGSMARVVRLEVNVDESHVATWIADGLVISSPTGSTGYSFSAGGPILDPTSRNIVVTSVAAYLSAVRTFVVSPAHSREHPGAGCLRLHGQHRRARGDAPARGRRGAGVRSSTAHPLHRAARRTAVLGAAATQGRAAADLRWHSSSSRSPTLPCWSGPASSWAAVSRSSRARRVPASPCSSTR